MEKRAKNVDMAIELALEELGISPDQAEIKVVSEGTRGFFGIGSKEAIVEVKKKEEEKPAAEQSETASRPTARRTSRSHEVKEKPAPRRDVQKTVAPKPETAAVSDSENCANAKTFLDKMFTAMGIDVTVNVEMSSDRNMSIILDSENVGILIGKRGDTLDSIQYLTSLVVNRKGGGEYVRVSIDTSQHYRDRREQSLKELAANKAERVAKTGKRYTLEPMNPYERRIIHSYLQNNENVTTYSVGSDPFRKVVIAPKNSRRYRSSYSGGGYRRGGRRGGGRGGYRANGYKSSRPASSFDNSEAANEPVTAEKKGSYTTTYKADFKPTQHRAQYASFEEYLAAQNKHED